MRFAEPTNPRSTIGTFSFTSFCSRRHARPVSGSNISPPSRAVPSILPPLRQHRQTRISVASRTILSSVCKIFSRRKHPAAQQLFAAASSNFLRPVHPIVLAQAQKMTRPVIGCESQVVEPEHHHA